MSDAQKRVLVRGDFLLPSSLVVAGVLAVRLQASMISGRNAIQVQQSCQFAQIVARSAYIYVMKCLKMNMPLC